MNTGVAHLISDRLSVEPGANNPTNTSDFSHLGAHNVELADLTGSHHCRSVYHKTTKTLCKRKIHLQMQM